MATPPKPTKRHTYDAAFRAEALRLASESRSTQAAARALTINPKLLYKWQQAAQTPVAAAVGITLEPATAAELRQLRALIGVISINNQSFNPTYSLKNAACPNC